MRYLFIVRIFKMCRKQKVKKKTKDVSLKFAQRVPVFFNETTKSETKCETTKSE